MTSPGGHVAIEMMPIQAKPAPVLPEPHQAQPGLATYSVSAAQRPSPASSATSLGSILEQASSASSESTSQVSLFAAPAHAPPAVVHFAADPVTPRPGCCGRLCENLWPAGVPCSDHLCPTVHLLLTIFALIIFGAASGLQAILLVQHKTSWFHLDATELLELRKRYLYNSMDLDDERQTVFELSSFTMVLIIFFRILTIGRKIEDHMAYYFLFFTLTWQGLLYSLEYPYLEPLVNGVWFTGIDALFGGALETPALYSLHWFFAVYGLLTYSVNDRRGLFTVGRWCADCCTNLANHRNDKAKEATAYEAHEQEQNAIAEEREDAEERA